MAKKTFEIDIRKLLVMLAVAPVVVTISILVLSCYKIMVENLEENTREELHLAAKALQVLYVNELKEGDDLVDGFCAYDASYIDDIGSVGVDLTLFKDNIRFMTTIRGADGKRIEGTAASDDVWKTVGLERREYYSDDVVINGTDYYVYYMPVAIGKDVYGMAFAGKPATMIQAAKRSIFLIVLVISLTLIAVLFVLAMILAKRVSDPLRVALDAITEIAKGKTRVEIHAESRIRETNELLQGAALLSAALTDTISGVKEKISILTRDANGLNQSALSVKGTIGNLDGAATEIAKGASSQANELTVSAASVSDVVLNIENIGDNIQETNVRTEEMFRHSELVNGQFEQLISVTRKSSQELIAISEKMQRVSDAVEAVVDAAEKINEIASQTNLLSLNASIEAARAGDAGRGFAVVANEINNLAMESNQSAEEIRSIMNTLKGETDRAVNMVNSMNQLMSEQVKTSEESQDELKELMRQITETNNNIQSIKKGSDQVQALCRSLSDSVSNLSAISEENAASTQETSAGISQMNESIRGIGEMAGELNQVAVNLEELTDYFSL